MNKLKVVFSQTDIIEAEPNKGISDITETYDQIKEVVRHYNSENYDQVEISRLSEPYKEYINIKERVFKETWDDIKDQYKRITEGDHFFLFRASYEISFFDDRDVYGKDLIPKGSPYWYWFRQYFLDYCEKNDRWTPADVCIKTYSWRYRNQVESLLVGEKRPVGESHLDYVDKVEEFEIDEKILELEKEFEEKKLAIKKSWD